MKIIDYFKRKRTSTSAVEEKIETIEAVENEYTLLQLANDGHTYWKFSQSQRGRSAEPVFIEYVPNTITTAEDSEKKLSFVNEKNILKCYMYGDVLTKFCFDISDEKFQTICNEKYHYIGGGLGEYESSKLLTENNYSLQKVETISVLFKLAKVPSDVIPFFRHFHGPNMEERLRKFGYYEAADFMKYLEKTYEADTLEGATVIINRIDEIAHEYITK